MIIARFQLVLLNGLEVAGWYSRLVGRLSHLSPFFSQALHCPWGWLIYFLIVNQRVNRCIQLKGRKCLVGGYFLLLLHPASEEGKYEKKPAKVDLKRGEVVLSMLPQSSLSEKQKKKVLIKSLTVWKRLLPLPSQTEREFNQRSWLEIKQDWNDERLKD